MRLIILFLLTAVCRLPAAAQSLLPYKNPALPVEQRVKDLLARMTPEEKFWQLFMIPGDLRQLQPGQYKHGIFGLQVSAVTAAEGSAQQMLQYNTTETAYTLANKINSIQRFFIEESRLGIPIIAFDEALHGLVRKNATAFPQAIALAASFDTALMRRVSAAIAVETRQRGIRDILSPVVNIASDVRWGRTEETYGEDPFLSARMGVAFVNELEKAGIISTPKHFLANVGDGGRDSYPIHWNERLLREIYLPPFLACFREGGSRSVMTAYNSLDGSPATAHDALLNGLLKKEWGFKGFVISDAGAVGGANVLHYTATGYPDATQKAITNGLDVIFQTQYEHYKLFNPPFLNNFIQQSRIDDAVARVLRAKFELGLFEDPYVRVDSVAMKAVVPVHRQIAKEAALKSAVLLKNEGQVLPLTAKQQRILVVGEEAKAGRLGGYSGPGIEVSTLWDGIRSQAPQGTVLTYRKGVARQPQQWKVIAQEYLLSSDSKEEGLTASYYSSADLTGEAIETKTETEIDHHWTLFGPGIINRNHFFSVRWKGYLKAPVSGTVNLAVEGNDGFRLWINGVLKIDQWSKESYHTRTVAVPLVKGKTYSIELQYREPTGNGHIRLLWDHGVKNDDEEQLKQAIAAAKSADIIIAAVGIHEGEFQDRAYLSLPGRQEEMIQQLAATGKPVVVLLTGGSAITMNAWIDRVKSVLHCWYPGEAGGEAIAELLFGRKNPSGKLPITFPVHESQLPLVYNHKPTGRGDDYHNLSGQPLFPFGFGLSYTRFGYSDLSIDNRFSGTDSAFTIRCRITNEGKYTGDEVVQLYVRDELASVARPVMELKGFSRISLAPGESRWVEFKLPLEQLKLYDAHMHWVFEPGDFRIMIGSSSRDIRLMGMLNVE